MESKRVSPSKLFNISRNTIDLWLKRLKETGDFAAKPNQPPGNNHKIRDWSKFQEFARTNGDKTQKEMAELWPEEISDRTISIALKKMVIMKKENVFMHSKVGEEKDELI